MCGVGECDESGVAAQYRGKSVFVIGGSGFLGKVLIEKLLYSCDGINKVYVLMRDNRNASAQQRLDKIFQLPVFSRLQKEKPWAMEKVAVVTGDLTSCNLGLSETDEEEMIEKVSYVFHLGATVNFNDPVELMFDINVGGTERVMNLCKRMKRLQKFVYVSTAFSNSNHQVIEERIYPLPFTLNAIKKQILGGLYPKEVEKLLGKLLVVLSEKSI
ncbi:putative fatty acyl-CoA reductase CG5065 [Aricia agestis]|uniref:putative fatty acyl-CoA reductase CG5065 n=1 Tax=Aricia agestis TaxID=91739 RepID=UPI001C20A83A|nr:putative fatty acyl-CoA reductase CG5065 [Aricia agestis]